MIQIIKLTQEEDIKSYIPSDALTEITKMSVALGRPLLLAGKPGAGKTQFAHWYVKKNAEEFNSVFQFNSKSTSIYNDLFYEYDAVSHFRNKDGDKDITEFITLTALGKAIVCAKGLDNITDKKLSNIALRSNLTPENCKLKSLVLIDEIDKAPRDFPNDLLHEIENLCFTIKETTPAIEVSLEDEQKKGILVFLTSNDEKNLPDAFLRRCLFHYIEFPNAKQLKTIIVNKLFNGEANAAVSSGIDNKLMFFEECQKSELVKKPSTSEWIDWINFLKNNNLLSKDIYKIDDTEKDINGLNEEEINKLNADKQLIISLGVLFKNIEDTDTAKKILNKKVE